MSAVRLKSGPRQRGVLLGKRRERSVTEEISLDEKSVLSFRVSHANHLPHTTSKWVGRGSYKKQRK